MENINLESYREKIQKVRHYTKDISVLIAEDYEPLHETISRLFKAIFKNVDSAYDGLEALNLYKQNYKKNNHHTLIFTDIEMPNLNGIELVKEIKKIEKTSEIIVFSAYQDSKYLLELINLGVRRFIPKPASLADILDELILVCNDIFTNETNQTTLLLSHGISYDKKNEILFLDNKQIDFTKQEHYIIELFMQKINLTVSNDEIVNYLYENMIDISISNVRKIMYKLRQKLPKDFIQGIYGIGYRIIAQSDNLVT